MTTVPDHYELLGLRLPHQTASDHTLPTEELKRAYKRALLRHHPDKQSPLERTGHARVTIDQISVAYQTLSDPARRADYDRQLKADRAEQTDERSRTRAPLYTGVETVDLGELECDEQAGLWTRSCRCGSQPAFVVTESELEQHVELGEVTIGCKGCSLWLRILYGVDG